MLPGEDLRLRGSLSSAVLFNPAHSGSSVRAFPTRAARVAACFALEIQLGDDRTRRARANPAARSGRNPFFGFFVYPDTMRFRLAAVCAVLGASLAGTVPLLEAQQSRAARPISKRSATHLRRPGSTGEPACRCGNKSGALATTLDKGDFELAIDGRQQPIRYFDRDNNLPLTLGLLVDISGSVRSALDDERAASEVFLDQMVTSPAGQPPDQAFLIQFAHEVDLLQDLTPSATRLRTALRKVGDEDREVSQDRGNSGDGGYGRRHGSRGGTTLVPTPFISGSNELMQKQQGRKAMVVLTDGDDRGSKETLDHAIAAAQRAETVIYAIYFKGEQHGHGGYGHGGFGGRGGSPGGGGRGGEQRVDGRKVLAQIAEETGGRTFEVSGKQTFAAIYNQHRRGTALAVSPRLCPRCGRGGPGLPPRPTDRGQGQEALHPDPRRLLRGTVSRHVALFQSRGFVPGREDEFPQWLTLARTGLLLEHLGNG